MIRFDSTVGTSDAAVVTPSGADVILGSVICINSGGTDRAVTVNIHRANGYIEPIVTGLNIPAGTAQELVRDVWTALGGTLVRQGEAMHASASGAGLTLLCFDL